MSSRGTGLWQNLFSLKFRLIFLSSLVYKRFRGRCWRTRDCGFKLLDDENYFNVSGRVKWFDPVKGYGFIVPDEGAVDLQGNDVLLHMSVLRSAGFSTVSENAYIACEAQQRDRGVQASRIISIDEQSASEMETPEDSDFPIPTGDDVAGGLLVPSRVKWFDKSKGFGFVNMHADEADVFVHMEVLRRFGLPDLDPGEAVLVRAVEGPRGRMACEVRPWDFSFRSG